MLRVIFEYPYPFLISPKRIPLSGGIPIVKSHDRQENHWFFASYFFDWVLKYSEPGTL
jgi:hypothetical protein